MMKARLCGVLMIFCDDQITTIIQLHFSPPQDIFISKKIGFRL